MKNNLQVIIFSFVIIYKTIKGVEMSQDKLDIILDAAYNIFAKYGYQKTSMDDIANEAMIGKGTIYYYFHSKEEIFLSILERKDNDLFNLIKSKINEAKTFEEKIKIFILEPFNHFMSNKQLVAQFLNVESPLFLKKLDDFKTTRKENIKQMLQEIFDFAIEKNVLRQNFPCSVEKVVDIIFKTLSFGGTNIKCNLSEENIDNLRNDYDILSDILINGLVSKEDF